MHDANPAFTIVLAMAVGVLAQSVARHLRLPGIVVLLAAGVALGPDGLGWVQPAMLGEGLFVIVNLAVAVILFEGGMNLEISRLRRAQLPIRRLVTTGALVTTLGGAAATFWIFGWPLVQSLLFGTLVVVTGPTVIGPLIRDLRLRPRVATVLEAEGVLIDPIGAILAVLMLEVALAPTDGEWLRGSTTLLLMRLGVGTALGALAGVALAMMLRMRKLVPDGHENILVLATVLLVFEGSQALVSESGLVAVVAAGVVVGNLRSRYDRDLREFKDQLTVLLIGMLFVLLAADVRLANVQGLGWRGIQVVLVLLLVVRPLAVWLSTRGSDLSARERWFVAWIAPRGIVAAAVASVTAGALTAAAIPGGTELRALVFLTIASTVTLAGLTAGPLAQVLGLRLPGRDVVAILGAQGLTLLLGRAMRDLGAPVVFLDSNPQNCRLAEEEGFSVVFGNALQERTMLRARLGNAGAVVGGTPNQMLNTMFTTRAHDSFGVPESYIAVVQPGRGIAMERVEQGDAKVLFDGPHDVERWDVRTRRGEVEVERWIHRGTTDTASGVAVAQGDSEPAPLAEALVTLCYRRGKRVRPVDSELAWKRDDVVAVAIYTPERDEAYAVLGAQGFAPWQPPETQPGAQAASQGA